MIKSNKAADYGVKTEKVERTGEKREWKPSSSTAYIMDVRGCLWPWRVISGLFLKKKKTWPSIDSLGNVTPAQVLINYHIKWWIYLSKSLLGLLRQTHYQNSIRIYSGSWWILLGRFSDWPPLQSYIREKMKSNGNQSNQIKVYCHFTVDICARQNEGAFLKDHSWGEK